MPPTLRIDAAAWLGDLRGGARSLGARPSGPPRAGETTARRDTWWAGPLATFLGLLAFLVYANYIVFFVPGYFEIRENKANFFARDNRVLAPYLAPFSSPLLFDAQSPHAVIHEAQPGWW